MNTFAHIFHVCFSCWECFRIESSHVTHHQSGRSSVVFLPYFVGKRHFFCKYFCVQIKKQHNSIAGAFPHGDKYKNNNIFYTNTFMHMCCFFLLVKSPFACVFITSLCLVYWEKKWQYKQHVLLCMLYKHIGETFACRSIFYAILHKFS